MATELAMNEKLASSEFIAKLEFLERMVRRLLRHRFAVSRSGQGERSLEFLEYRLYLPGDDLKRLDLNVYRRLNEYVVREYVREEPNYWMIALDSSASMGLYGKFNFARQLAAALLYLGVSIVGRVVFYIFPGQTSFFCHDKKFGVKRILYALDQLKATDPQPQDFYPLPCKLPPHSTVILISDLYDQLYQNFFTSLKLKKMHTIALHLSSTEEQYPSLKGSMILQDAESKAMQKLQIGSATIARYKERFAYHIEEIKQHCQKKKIFYQNIQAHESLSNATLKALKLTGLLR